jgi:sugar phosphate isomerase/epimerase
MTEIAAQLYTVYEFLQTPQEIARSLKKVAQIGYRAVQVSGLGPIDTDELKSILDAEGLVVCATHVDFEELRIDLDAVIDYQKTLDCNFVAIGSMPLEYRDEEGYRRFAEEINPIAKELSKAGLVFGYHNHSFELERFGEKTGLEIFFNACDAEFVTAEFDTYWLQNGGADPIVWIESFSDRVPVIHLKDMKAQSNDSIMAEVGEGNMNWQGIIAACKKAGTRWYVVEQDYCQRDPFDSLAISFSNLKNMGLR